MLYPIDRYMVDSSKSRGLEMVNILEDESWTAEPTLRPEDELVLRRLRDLLQSTAEDLKELSGELATAREPPNQPKVHSAPLDDDFNQKVHIEQVVNARFHGDKTANALKKHSPITPKVVPRKSVSAGIQVDIPTKIIKMAQKESNERISQNKRPQVQKPQLEPNKITKDFMPSNIKRMPSVAYNEFLHKYKENPTKPDTPRKLLKIQEMPSINIRRELRQQKVVHLDILPEQDATEEPLTSKTNTAVIEIQHHIKRTEPISIKKDKVIHMEPTRKISKMSAGESSDYNSSDVRTVDKSWKSVKSTRIISQKQTIPRKPDKQSHPSMDDWKKKLNAVYGRPSTSQHIRSSIRPKNKLSDKKTSLKKSNIAPSTRTDKFVKLNNAEYVPYSKLTLGGVRLSDIEREISNIRADEPLSPIIDRILCSRENSFNGKEKSSPKVLTTSDENLLQEVINIEKNVNKTIVKNFTKVSNTKQSEKRILSQDDNNTINENSSYDDDFEEVEKTKSHSSVSDREDNSSKTNLDLAKNSDLEHDDKNILHDCDRKDDTDSEDAINDPKNKTFVKSSNLSFKNSVDIFEFVHSIDTQDSATQSNAAQKLSLKGTQTSPRQDVSNVQPIHNDLWQSSIDPRGEVEKMFKLEKEFIRKLILEEYGDVLEKDITKPSTSKDRNIKRDDNKNVTVVQKITQTSPAQVKSVMTSPRKTKTRTTSPISLTLHVHRHTSPIVHTPAPTESQSENEGLGISINLSSPRFSLRLPQTTREVLSNLDTSLPSVNEEHKKKARVTNNQICSSSSVDADRSDSELSSFGEIKLKLRRRQKSSLATQSDSSFNSTYSSSEVQSTKLRLKSEGEISLGQLL